MGVLQMPVAAVWQNMGVWGGPAKTPTLKKTPPLAIERGSSA